MALGRYRIADPIIGLFKENDHLIARDIPVGAIVTVETGMIEGDDLITITWEGQEIVVFAQDMRARSVPFRSE